MSFKQKHFLNGIQWLHHAGEYLGQELVLTIGNLLLNISRRIFALLAILLPAPPPALGARQTHGTMVLPVHGVMCARMDTRHQQEAQVHQLV